MLIFSLAKTMSPEKIFITSLSFCPAIIIWASLLLTNTYDAARTTERKTTDRNRKLDNRLRIK